MSDSQTYRIQRDGDVDLQFTGRQIGFGSSQESESRRWFEVRIYDTSGGKYVVEGVGMSTISGERNRRWAVVCDTATDVVDALYRTDRDGTPFLTNTARAALDEAAEHDVEFETAIVEEIA